ncbi:hypothetical protein [Fictibacillus sp. FJAT-27399]|nr:hypothetical protein [Fictibacillus sp. FJAT-27399]SFF16998.1 hypothetical protein SAMN05428981_12013 [Bacillus sp. OV194]
MDKKRETINEFAKNKRKHNEKKKTEYIKNLKQEHQNQDKN